MVEALVDAACAGAQAIQRLLNSGEEVTSQLKADRSVVLSLDLASDKAIRERLAQKLPLISEEDEGSHQFIQSAKPFIIVDPLDGTASCQRYLRSHGKEFLPGQVGFGPMVALIENRCVSAVAFVSLTERKVFKAQRGVGSFEAQLPADMSTPAQNSFKKLFVKEPLPLPESAALFFPGLRGEIPLTQYLREHAIIDMVYRFGGYANDCSRIARGFEQIHIQLSLKPWDLPAALFAAEAGYAVIMEPFGKQIPFATWQLAEVNPTIIVHQGVKDSFLSQIRNYGL